MFELLGLGAHEVEAAAAANRGAAPAAYVVLVERALVEWAAGCRAEGTLQPARRRERAHVDTRAAAHADRRVDPTHRWTPAKSVLLWTIFQAGKP